MFSRHVTKDISAYCHGELSSEKSKQFAEHIISCARCRTKYEEVKLGIKLAEQLPKLSAPERLWDELQPLLGQEPVQHTTTPRLWSWQVQLPAAAAILLILSFGLLWFSGNPVIPRQKVPQTISLESSWRVTRVDGNPTIASEKMSNNGRLGVGEWLETDASSRAQIAVGSIGHVDVDENTRIRLVTNEPTEHRLELARGRMSARILAPPRLFFVDTPSAVAADMGCAYTLEVDDRGGSLLHVTSGWVELELKGRSPSIVPAGAACETRPNLGPGTPYFDDASPAFREALKKIDFNSDATSRSAALKVLLSHARDRDSLTLWHLLRRVDGDDRLRLYERLVPLIPDGAKDREAILAADEKFLHGWRLELERAWGTSSKFGLKKFGGAESNVKGILSEKEKARIPR